MQRPQATYATATQAQVPEEYQRAQLDVAQAKANLALNQSIVNARKQLFAEGAIPGRDLDTAQAALVQAQAAYETAVKHLEAQKSVARQASLEAAKGQLASAEGKYQGAEAQVAYSEIRSPISGVVTERPLFAGETVAAGSTLLTVMDTSVVLAKVHLAQELAQQLKLGDAATITVPGLAEPVLAKVSLISPALDPGSTTVEIWLRIDNKKGGLKVGTPVHASIVGREARQALTVPLSALLTAQDGSKSVMVVACRWHGAQQTGECRDHRRRTRADDEGTDSERYGDQLRQLRARRRDKGDSRRGHRCRRREQAGRGEG